MKLAAISGINGVYSDQDIKKVVTLALKARAKGKKAEEKQPSTKVATKRAAPAKKPSGKAKAIANKAAMKGKPATGASRERTI
jgi:Mg-chelatase subunit ChlI